MNMETQTLPLGTILDSGINQYRIVEVLGQGGFGITYRANATVKVGNIELKASFAIKEHFIREYNQRQGTTVAVPNPSNAQEINESIGAFITEAERLNRLSLKHPGIVKVNECFRANDTAYYVMEFIEGENLRHYVERHDGRRLAESEALSIIKQISESLSYLHSHQVTHLDIKPDNILLREDGQPVLIDFGLAKHYDKRGQATSTMKVIGTSEGYSPLEQYAGIDHFSPEADVYALAATLFFMLIGRDPKKAADIRTTDIASALEGRAESTVAQAIVHAMQKLQEYRTPSVGTFLQELGMKDATGGETESSGGKRTEKIKSPPANTIWKQKSLLLKLVAGLAIAVLLVIVVFLIKDCQRSSTEDYYSDDYETVEFDSVAEEEPYDDYLYADSVAAINDNY